MRKTLICAVLLLAVFFVPVLAEEDAARPWTNSTEFGLINASGNSEASSFAFGNKFAYKWSNAEFNFDMGALRNSSKTSSRSNLGGALVVDVTDETTAENYFLDTKYKRTISDQLYWYAGLGWDRDRFAGIDSRFRGGGGLGYVVFKTDLHSLVTELGFDYTDEKHVAGTKDDHLKFGGLRGFAAYKRKVGASSQFDASLEVLENLKDTGDMRAIGIVSLTATMTTHMALKASFTMKYDGDPVVEVLSDPASTPELPIPDVLYEFDNLDTILSASLVVNF